jgi:choline dehydrogenase
MDRGHPPDSRRIIAQPAFDELRGKELAPGDDVQSDAEILDFVAREGESAYHPAAPARWATTTWPWSTTT